MNALVDARLGKLNRLTQSSWVTKDQKRVEEPTKPLIITSKQESLNSKEEKTPKSIEVIPSEPAPEIVITDPEEEYKQSCLQDLKLRSSKPKDQDSEVDPSDYLQHDEQLCGSFGPGEYFGDAASTDSLPTKCYSVVCL